MDAISKKDLEIIRSLANQQYEYSQADAMKSLKKEWLNHNTFKGSRPMVYIELGTFEQEIVPPLLKCEGKQARDIETNLYRNFVNHTMFGDDFPVPDYYSIAYSAKMKLFDIDVEVVHTDGLGHQFVHQINNLEADFDKFKKSTYTFNTDDALKAADDMREILGGSLPVKIVGTALYAVPTQCIVHLMGMENMLYSMYDYPDMFTEMMNRIADDYIEYFTLMSEKGLMLPTIGNEHLPQGTWCYTDELPDAAEREKRKFGMGDVWGFMDSQETVGISPDMFFEFIAPCYEKVAKQYGLLSYGCCEPVDPIWDDWLSKFENLRKVSISPWCNEEFMGERLKGKKVIYQRKPSPNYLGVDEVLDEQAVRAHMRRTMEAANGCKLEITQRDVYSVGNNPEKVRRYVEIIRDCAEKYYKY